MPATNERDAGERHKLPPPFSRVPRTNPYPNMEYSAIRSHKSNSFA